MDISDKVKRRMIIVKMRGLGYNEKEISEKVGVSASTIQYILSRLRKRARIEGNDKVFMSIMYSYLTDMYLKDILTRGDEE